MKTNMKNKIDTRQISRWNMIQNLNKIEQCLNENSLNNSEALRLLQEAVQTIYFAHSALENLRANVKEMYVGTFGWEKGK